MVVAFLRKSPFYKKGINMDCGNYNGYVAFKEKLPPSYQSNGFYNIKDEEYLDYLVGVHGGITFDGIIQEDTPIIPLTEIPEDIHSYRVIGFDCCHYNDTSEYWTFERTKEETLELKEQIENLIKELNQTKL